MFRAKHCPPVANCLATCGSRETLKNSMFSVSRCFARNINFSRAAPARHQPAPSA
ncbi:MAG: hypothetical protein MPL62_02905 [Alphaproteobacteria bacterium]|nr:hypothetical protein [Alphaproteobacteria bacterium]